MAAYYNEIDKFAAQWLCNLIADGQIAPGDVDTRPIQEVHPDDLKPYKQCHFFAGIGGWSIALRFAGWSDERPVWTGSCPCQPFSMAGRKKGHSDERHLWPHWSRLISKSKPATVFGEQVAAAVTFGWWDEVAADLEAQEYACAAAVLPACSVGAPHKRDRLWFVADSKHHKYIGAQQGKYGKENQVATGKQPQHSGTGESSGAVIVGAGQAHTNNQDISNSIHIGCKGRKRKTVQGQPGEPRESQRDFEDFNNGWSISAPKICGVDDGILGRTPKLRGYGNAIVPQVAAEFIKAVM